MLAFCCKILPERNKEMLVKEIFTRENALKKAKFVWADWEQCDRATAESMPNMHASYEGLSSNEKNEVWRLLCTKEQTEHARKVRHVSSCIECLRLGFCQDISSELRAEAAKHGQIDCKFKGS